MKLACRAQKIPSLSESSNQVFEEALDLVPCGDLELPSILGRFEEEHKRESCAITGGVCCTYPMLMSVVES